MKWFQNTVTRRFNVRHREWGRLFGDRYKAVVVDGGNRYYDETLWDYIPLNPSRARLVDLAQGQSVLDYPWSSIGRWVGCLDAASKDEVVGGGTTAGDDGGGGHG